MKGGENMNKIKKISFFLIILFALFPSIASASEIIVPTNEFVLLPDITIKESNSSARAAQREAVVKDTAKQNLFEGKWESLFDIKYKSIWFTNSVRENGYTQIKKVNYFNYTQYTWRFNYIVS